MELLSRLNSVGASVRSLPADRVETVSFRPVRAEIVSILTWTLDTMSPGIIPGRTEICRFFGAPALRGLVTSSPRRMA